MSQMYILAQNQRSLELVCGDFLNNKVGDTFERDQAHFGANYVWTIVKILRPEEQKLLRDIEAVLSLEGFWLLKKMFTLEVR